MDADKQERIVRFLDDERLSGAVKESLRESFLKNRKVTDVNYLAGQMIAFNLLNEAFMDLEKYRAGEEIRSVSSKQVGV